MGSTLSLSLYHTLAILSLAFSDSPIVTNNIDTSFLFRSAANVSQFHREGKEKAREGLCAERTTGKNEYTEA